MTPRIFVFVALERIGGFMCWDVSDPEAPVFQVKDHRSYAWPFLLPGAKHVAGVNPFVEPPVR